jgi:long-chain acyl-CoA synthetase
VPARAFADEVTAVAKGLVASGVDPGDRVAIMSRTRYEWTVVDFAVWASGAVGVPVYETSSADQVHWILSDSDVRAVVVETPAHAALVAGVRGDLPHLTDVWTLDDDALAALVSAGAGVDDAEVARRTALAGTSDLATIIYTSGTTGRPKGVELTHGNFVHLALNGAIAFHDVCATPGSRTLLFMPLAHVFARFIQVLCIPSGATMGYTPDPKQLLPDLASFRPTFILAVPRVFEKVYNSAEQRPPRRRCACGSSGGPHRCPSRTRARSRPAAAPPPRCAPSKHSPTASCTAGCAPRSAVAHGGRSRAGRRSASGSGTSTAASACACSRATA